MLVALGALVGALGCLVYMSDRDPAHALLFPAMAALGSGPVFGVIGGWLPSFVHPFTFSLFSAATWRRSASPGFGACGAWWLVNIGFEAAQHPQLSGRLADLLAQSFGHSAWARALSAYALHGSFQVADLVAATAGALAAAVVLQVVHHRELQHAPAAR